MGRHGKGKSRVDRPDLITNPLETIQSSILDRMHRGTDPSCRFICNTNLKDAWEEHGTNGLESVFPSKSWSSQDHREINKDYRKIISILIIINWQGFATKLFRSQFFRQEGRKDANLPFTIDQLTFLGSAKSLFFEWQFAFAPAAIEYHEGKHIQTIDPLVRLPFVNRGERMGIGSYGEVLKVSIARELYQDKSRELTNWSGVETVAVKVYHSDSETSEKDFHKEVKRLDYLKEGYHDSRRVMKHIAAIVHGDIFMIVLPLAKLRDLEVFLRGGRQTDGDTRSEQEVYEFDNQFKALRDNNTLHRELIRECFEISSALLWLHEELRIYGKLDRYLAHMDLKPDNILIDSEIGHLAGKWMISDFGVSLFDKATNEPASDVLSARDIGRRATSRANETIIHRNHVGYSAPEIGLSTFDGRKCDVWSFVCILCDVLAFSLGRSHGLREFRRVRFDEDDNFFTIKASHVDRKRIINGSNTEVKQKILAWLRHMDTENSYPWVSELVKVIRQGLIPDPSIRAGIRTVMEGLDRISTSSTIASLAISATSTEDRHSQQLEVPLMSPNHGGSVPINPQEASHGEGSGVQPSDTVQPMSTPALDHTPQINSLESNGSVLKVSISEPSSSSNMVQNANTRDQPIQNHHPISHDTQGSQTINHQTLVRSGETSRGYRELSPLTLPLKPKATLNAVALHRTGGHVAMLFERRDENEQRQCYEVYIYPIHDDVHDDITSSRKVNLSSHVHWTQVWTAQRYFAVGGKSAGQEFIEVHDIQNIRYVRYLHTSHPRYQGRPCSQVALSDAGIAAAIYGPHVIVADLKLENSEYAEFSIDAGYSIKKANFGAISNVLCIWAVRCTESSSAVDVVYFYNVTAPRPELISKGLYSKADKASIELKLMPFPNIDACVIREQKGGTFIAHPNHLQTAKAQSREYSGIPYALVACVTFDDMLICVEKNKTFPGMAREIREYPLREQKLSGVRSIGPASKVLGFVDRSVDEKAHVAVHLTEDRKQMLVLCTSKGVVLRFLQSD